MAETIRYDTSDDPVVANEIAEREAVVKGYNFMDKKAKIPLP